MNLLEQNAKVDEIRTKVKAAYDQLELYKTAVGTEIRGGIVEDAQDDLHNASLELEDALDDLQAEPT